MFYHGFFFFFYPLISKLAERNKTISGHMAGSKCNLKMHVRNLGYPFPYKSGVQKLPSAISQLKGNFNGL